jgi:alkylation response protein AidB-like acyl-CoA dehydrogenase
MQHVLDRARRIADDVLFPAALDVDASGSVPQEHLALLAEEGFYSLVAPREIGGAGLDLTELLDVLEAFAGGCLATASVWQQHHGVMLALVDTGNTALWAEYLGSMMTGRLRASVAYTGAVPGPARLVATRVDGGFLLNGVAPAVIGWDSVDLLLLSASEHDSGLDDVIVTGLVDVTSLDGVGVDRLVLAAGHATGTVALTFADYLLPDDRVTREVRRCEFTAGGWFTSRVNGSLCLGVASRCVRMLAEYGRRDLADMFGFQLTRARNRLDVALEQPAGMPSARAEAAELAYRAAGATMAAVGGDSLLASHHAQLLVRNAAFAMVASSRAEVTTDLVKLLGRSPSDSGSVVPPLPL